MSANDWAAVAAIASCATTLIAGVALLFARGQVAEARKTREAVAQPNVVVYVDHNRDDWQILEFVVKNFGETPAYAIAFEGLPDLDVVPWEHQLTGDTVTKLYIPESIAILAPGQEWRTIWDNAIAREDYELERQQHPDRNLRELRSVFVGEVRFRDNEDRQFKNPIRLDANAFRDMQRYNPT